MPSPRDWRDHVIYQLLLDRFDDDEEHPHTIPNCQARTRRRVRAASFRATIKASPAGSITSRTWEPPPSGSAPRSKTAKAIQYLSRLRHPGFFGCRSALRHHRRSAGTLAKPTPAACMSFTTSSSTTPPTPGVTPTTADGHSIPMANTISDSGAEEIMSTSARQSKDDGTR